MTKTSQTLPGTNWSDHLQELLQRADNAHITLTCPGLTTGLPNLDAMTGGMPRGEITVVAHNGSLRPNWLIWNLALNAARLQPKPVLIWTQEWNPLSVTSALTALHCRLPYGALRHGCLTQSQWDAISMGLPSLETLPLHLVNEHAKTAADIVEGVKKWTQCRGEPAMVVVPDLASLHWSGAGYGGSACHQHARHLLGALQSSDTCLLIGCMTRASTTRSRGGDIPSYNDVSGWPEMMSDVSLTLMPLWDPYWRRASPEHLTHIFLYGKGRHHADIYTCRADETGLYWEEPENPA